MQGVVTRLYHVLPPPGNRETGFLPRGAAVSKNFQKFFCAHALKKEVGALLWQNGNETSFRETELAFLIRLFTGYLQLYPTHTKLLLALQRLRDTARARSLLNAVFSFERNNTARGCFRPGRFSVFPFWRRSAVRLESLPLCGEGLGCAPITQSLAKHLSRRGARGGKARLGCDPASPFGDALTPAAPAAGCPPRRRAQRSAGRQTRRASRAWTRR